MTKSRFIPDGDERRPRSLIVRRLHPWTLFALLLLSTVPASGQNQPFGKYHPVDVPTTAGADTAVLQGFDMRLWLNNRMTLGRNAWSGIGYYPEPALGCEYPYGSGIEHLFGAGPMIGAIVNGARLVSQGYNGDNGRSFLRPDPNRPARARIWQTSVADSAAEPNRRGCDDDGDGLVDEDELDGLDNDGDWDPGTDDVGADGLADLLEVGCRGGYDPVLNPDPAQDDFEPLALNLCRTDSTFKADPDLYTEGNGIPDHGEPNVDEDYGAASDQDVYCFSTDTVTSYLGGEYRHVPMGVLVSQKSYAWKEAGYGAVIPLEYSFVNISGSTMHSVFLGMFVDADVGPVWSGNYFLRNYSCFLPEVRTAYVHNPIDRGSTPIGLTVLGGPRSFDSLQLIFRWFNFTTSPGPGTVDSMLYGWMSGEFWPDDPIPVCESPTNPSDSRFLVTMGPVESFAPGETLRVSFALVSGEGIEPGPNSLAGNASKAVNLHERMKVPGMRLPASIVHSPGLRVTQVDGGVGLDWGSSAGGWDPMGYWDPLSRAAESFPADDWRRRDPPCGTPATPGECLAGPACDSAGRMPGGRTFEGFRLYRSDHQGNSPEGTFVLLREFDIPGDGIGFDQGVDTSFADTTLRVGRRYWYAVTSYTIPEISIVEYPGADGTIRRDTVLLPGTESPITGNMASVTPTFRASGEPGRVTVVPNPYRVDADYTTEGGGWEGDADDWTDYKRKIRFIHLPRKCTIRIFTVAGDVVAGMAYEAPDSDPDEGYLDWRLVTPTGRPLASGVYVFTVDSEYGTQYGKFVVIR